MKIRDKLDVKNLGLWPSSLPGPPLTLPCRSITKILDTFGPILNYNCDRWMGSKLLSLLTWVSAGALAQGKWNKEGQLQKIGWIGTETLAEGISCVICYHWPFCCFVVQLRLKQSSMPVLKLVCVSVTAPLGFFLKFLRQWLMLFSSTLIPSVT